MIATTLADRALLRLSGEDVHGFIDGLVTNSVVGDLPVYTALLSPQGKVIADFIVWQDGEDLLLDVSAAQAESLNRRLAMYRLRRAITITIDSTLAVHWSPEEQGGPPDPRLPALGYRWLAPPSEPASGWDERRLRNGVAEGPELSELLWLECNAAELNGVSFTKGCFVGQENTARMNWRQKINRRLFVVAGEAPDERVRGAFPKLGLTLVHARVDSVPAGAIIPNWLASALSE